MKTRKTNAVACTLWAIVLCIGCSRQEKINWQTEKASRNSISEMVSATGTVEPVTQVEVGTQVSGIVDKIYVDYNSVVKKGQLIAEDRKSVV